MVLSCPSPDEFKTLQIEFIAHLLDPRSTVTTWIPCSCRCLQAQDGQHIHRRAKTAKPVVAKHSPATPIYSRDAPRRVFRRVLLTVPADYSISCLSGGITTIENPGSSKASYIAAFATAEWFELIQPEKD